MLLSMATLGIVSCSDKLTDDIGKVEDIGGETGYLSFRIKSADTGSMRAWNDTDDDYAEGEEDQVNKFANEDAVVANIQANRIFFFDANDKYHSSSILKLEGSDAENDGTHGTSKYPEKIYTATVKRTGDRGSNDWPAKCLVVLNGRPSRLNALLIKAQAGENFNLEQFLAYVNEDFRNLGEDPEGETLGLYKYEGEYYFTMTNSVFHTDDSNPTTETLTNATKINSTDFKTTSQEAAENPITIYVERIMSKVEVGFAKYEGAGNNEVKYFSKDVPYLMYSFEDAEGKPSSEASSGWFGSDKDFETPIGLKAMITNWTLNAAEYQTLLFKDINFEGEENQEDETWQANSPFAGWNDKDHHRSYWARDNHYVWNQEEYPTQYRTSFTNQTNAKPYQQDWKYGVSEAEGGQYYNDIAEPDYPWALDYKAYNKGFRKKQTKYCLENTFALNENENDYKHMIMGTHLLVLSRLIIASDGTEDDEISEEAKIKALGNNVTEDKLDEIIKDKYYYSDRYYDEKTYINRQVAQILEIMTEDMDGTTYPNIKMWKTEDDIANDAEDKDEESQQKTGNFSFDNIKGGLWYKEDGKFLKVTVNSEAKEGEEILATDIFTIAPAYVDKGDGKVTIALKGSDDEVYGYGDVLVNLYYLPEVKDNLTDDDYVQMTRNQLVSLIYTTNIADCFKNGRMYYAVPVQHFIASGKDEDYEYKYEDLNTGDYGIVRNHWYKFTINNVLKPGVPVHNPEQPIIPNYDNEDRYIGLQVVILPWHIVDNGNVTLGQ